MDVTIAAAGSHVFHQLTTLYRRERVLFAVGLLGVALGVSCLAYMAIGGRYIPPEGDLMKPATFDIAVGLYVLTLALYAPFAGFTARGHRRWVVATTLFVLYGLTVETVQQLRGIDPRFSDVASAPERLAGLLFFVTAVMLIPLFGILVAKIRAGRARRLLPLAVGYAAISVAIGFGAGIWMSVQGGSSVGDADVLPLHAIGFHGIQAVPLVALLLVWAAREERQARSLVHAAGIAWLVACVAVLIQTAAGRPLESVSTAIVVAAVALLFWAATALRAILVWRVSGWNVPRLPPLDDRERTDRPEPAAVGAA